jgi:ribosomal protein S18 acetylase RimI-like enzyme
MTGEEPQFELRRFRDEDAEAVWRLHDTALEDAGVHGGRGPWEDDLRDIPAIYLERGGEFLVGFAAGELVGMGGLLRHSAEEAEIKRMRVHPDFQRCGLGRLILERLEARARVLAFQMIRLDTTEEQSAARRLYESAGYEEQGRRRTGRFLFIDFSKALALLTAFVASLFLLVASPAEAGLAFERPDGSAIRFEGRPRAWCGPWDDEVARPSIHVALRNGRRGWELSAVRRDLEVGEPIEFPNAFVSSRPRGAQLFVASGRIEASTAEEESSGSMAFSRLSCRLAGLVEFSIDAVLGSELFGGKRVKVSGTYRGRMSKPPTASRGE